MRPFDFNTINDVVLHIKYTALEGPSMSWDRSQNVIDKMDAHLLGIYPGSPGTEVLLPRIFSLRHEFSTQWHAYITNVDSSPEMEIKLRHAHFPAFCKRHNITVTALSFAIRLKDNTVTTFDIDVDGRCTTSSVDVDIDATSVTTSNTPASLSAALPVIDITDSPELTLNLRFPKGGLLFNLQERIEDVYMIAIYKLGEETDGTDEIEEAFEYGISMEMLLLPKMVAVGDGEPLAGYYTIDYNASSDFVAVNELEEEWIGTNKVSVKSTVDYIMAAGSAVEVVDSSGDAMPDKHMKFVVPTSELTGDADHEFFMMCKEPLDPDYPATPWPKFIFRDILGHKTSIIPIVILGSQADGTNTVKHCLVPQLSCEQLSTTDTTVTVRISVNHPAPPTGLTDFAAYVIASSVSVVTYEDNEPVPGGGETTSGTITTPPAAGPSVDLELEPGKYVIYAKHYWIFRTPIVSPTHTSGIVNELTAIFEIG